VKDLKDIDAEIERIDGLLNHNLTLVNTEFFKGKLEVLQEIKVMLKHKDITPKMRYKTEKELMSAISNFREYNTLSGSEKCVFDALRKLSADYRMRLYIALYDLIDNFLW